MRVNLAPLHEAGAELFVGGSSIFWQGDPAAGYRSLCGHLTSPAP